MNIHGICCGGYEGSSGGYGKAIPAAVKTRHSVEVKNVNYQSEPIKEQLIDVGGQSVPLTLNFRSVSSNIKVLSSHQPGHGETQHTSSEDEPHKLFHEVNKPIIQEVREVISPYRRIIQEVRPVQEDIHTVIAKGNGGYGNNIGGGGGYGGNKGGKGHWSSNY